LFLGERARGLIFLVVIAVTFWSGVAVGAVRYTVDPQERTAWFMAQICSGSHALAAYRWSKSVQKQTPEPKASPAFQSSEAGVVYTGVAGLLNVLVIFDALVRAESGRSRLIQRPRQPGVGGSS